VSNAKHAKWSEAEVTAATAERLLGELWTEGEAYAARTVIMRDLAHRFEAAGATPGQVAMLEQAAMGMGDEFWAGVYRERMAEP
jgi:hypothetical protein